MADYVLVHGGDVSTETWNKFTKGKPIHTDNGRLGYLVWEPVASVLKAHGHRVFAPTLKSEYSCGLTGHIEQVCALIDDNNLENIILAGHSYGGIVVTGVADRIPKKISRLVYLDSSLPDPGQSLFDVLLSNGKDPASVAGLEPVAPYTEKLQFDWRNLDMLPKTYIRCMESEFTAVTAAAIKKLSCRPNGCQVTELPTGHLPQATMPDELAQILLKSSRPIIFGLI